MHSEAVTLLSQLIAIESFSREEKNVADFLERYLVERGYVVSRSGNNLWLMSPGFDTARPTILLNSHIDTVRPVAAWVKNPFKPIIENGKLYGLGSNDAGASLVSLLFAFMQISALPQHYNLIFSATAEEEISGENGIENLLKELPKIDFAIVGEPTEMHAAIAEKGLMVLDCAVYGQAGHAARCEGDNAIYKAIEAIRWVKEFQFEKVSDVLGPVKMSVTQIHAGTQHNVIPDKCSFVVDVRSNELYSNEALLQIIKEHLTCDVHARSTRLSSTATPVNHPVVMKLISMNRKTYGSPTLSDQALMPFASVKLGPGKSERSHTADEYILIEEIDEAIALYVRLLDGLQL